MYTCSLHIVALPYYEVGECLGDFFAEAEGRAMTLRPEPTNDYDARAIQAFDWQGRHVGYVASADLLEAWQALRGSGRHSLRGKICDLNAEHKCIGFECKVETIGDVPNLYPESPFLEWHYSGPVMKPTKEMVKLDYMMDEIGERLDEHDSWTTDDRDDFMKLGGRFCEVTKYDLSGDMADYRRRLILRILALKDTDLMPLVEELKMAYGRAGRESHEGDVLNYWMTVLSDSAVTRTLLKNRHKYDIDVVRQELQQFPESMYEEWLDNREHFVSKLLYMHIPRTVLWQLVSGIAFVGLSAAELISISSAQKASEGQGEPSRDVHVNVNIGTAADVVAEGGTKIVRNIQGDKKE